MSDEQIFRWLFVVIFVAVLSLSVYFRRRARRSGEVIARVREGKPSLFLRLLSAALLYLPVLAYMVNPRWMAWSSIPLPAWLQWVGAAVGFTMIPLVYWVMRTLGRNVSETVLTKSDHQLVTNGPYRWVRHPLYAAATVTLISLGILSASWFIILMALLAIVGVALMVIPAEEDELTRKFGNAYREYRDRTGKLIPRVKSSRTMP